MKSFIALFYIQEMDDFFPTHCDNGNKAYCTYPNNKSHRKAFDF